jgi:hypothetical protein
MLPVSFLPKNKKHKTKSQNYSKIPIFKSFNSFLGISLIWIHSLWGVWSSSCLTVNGWHGENSLNKQTFYRVLTREKIAYCIGWDNQTKKQSKEEEIEGGEIHVYIWLHTNQLWKSSTINIPQLSRIYHRGSQVVVSKNFVYSHTNMGVLDTAPVIAPDSLTSDRLRNTPVSTQTHRQKLW